MVQSNYFQLYIYLTKLLDPSEKPFFSVHRSRAFRNVCGRTRDKKLRKISSVSSSMPERLYFLAGAHGGCEMCTITSSGTLRIRGVSRSCANKSRLAGILLNAPTFRRAINPTVESTMHFASVESNLRAERVDANRPSYRSSRAKQLSVALHASLHFRGFFPGRGCGTPFL